MDDLSDLSASDGDSDGADGVTTDNAGQADGAEGADAIAATDSAGRVGASLAARPEAKDPSFQKLVIEIRLPFKKYYRQL